MHFQIALILPTMWLILVEFRSASVEGRCLGGEKKIEESR